MPEPRDALIFGDLIDDVIVVPGGPIRPDTDTTSAIRTRAGGSAANTAAWLAGTGAGVVFVGRCGTADAARHAELLEVLGVEARVTADPALPTGTIVVIVEGDRRTMLTERGANAALSPAHVDPRGFRIVHATGYSLVDYPDEFAGFVARAHETGARVSLNVGSVAAIDELGRERFAAAVRDVDVLVATADEACALTGAADPETATRALGDRHPLAAVTAGRRGAWICAGGAVDLVPATPADAVDPTGAGDAFTAGLLAGVLAGDDARSAAVRGTRLAARAVQTAGARPPAQGTG